MCICASVDALIPFEEADGSRAANLELQGLKDRYLHLEDVLLAVRLVSDVNKLLDLRRVDFFKLCSNQKC